MSKAKRRTGIFLKDGKYQIYVPGRVGLKQRSTGTGDKALARKIKRAVADVRDAHDWEILDALYHGKITLTRMYAAYANRSLDELRAELNAIRLLDHVDEWGRWVRSMGGTSQTASTYRAQVETLIHGDMKLHELTAPKISKWLTDLPDITPGTRRKYLYALRSFVSYLQSQNLIQYDPSAAVKTPRKNKPRLVWQLEEVDKRIVDASPREFQALFALIKATGAEVSPALAMTRNDIDLQAGLVHIKGTKTENRDRHDAIIEPWALPYLRDHCRSLIGNVPLWPSITRYRAHDVHQSSCKELGIRDYTLRDARHSWAVRSRKRGESLEAIKEQLGHSSIYMAATVYGQFRATMDERKERKGTG